MRLRDAAVLVLVCASMVPAAGTLAAVTRFSPAEGLGSYRYSPKSQVEAGKLEGTTWRLISLPGHSSEDLAVLRRPVSLRLAEGRVTGFSGCNLMTGTYTIKDTSVTLDLAGTLMACPEPGSSIERAFLQALKGPLSYRAGPDRLTLTTASGVALEFDREAPETLEGGTWQVTGYNNGRQAVVSPISDTQLTLSFEDDRLSGQAGCNTFRASYKVQANRVAIGPIATTRKMCGEEVMAQERAFLAALESATRWTIEGGTLDMHRADDERALTATR